MPVVNSPSVIPEYFAVPTDTSLTEAERNKLPSMTTQKILSTYFDQIDTNGNGTITRAEFEQFMRANGHELQFWGDQSKQFGALANYDGKVTRSDLMMLMLEAARDSA